jgi:MFS family permease
VKFFIEAHATPREQAGVLLSYLPLTAMIATPLFGLLVDRIGQRSLLLAFGSLLIAPAYLLLARRGIPLLLPVALMGLAFSLIPAVLWPAVAYLVEERRLGTAYSLMTLLQQLGFFAVSSLLGWANDHGQASASHPQGYALGLFLLTGLSLLGLTFSLLLWRSERGRSGHGLETIPGSR